MKDSKPKGPISPKPALSRSNFISLSSDDLRREKKKVPVPNPPINSHYTPAPPPPMPENPQNRRRLSKRPEKHPPPPPAPLPSSSSSKNAPRDGKNVDHDLFTNLVDMVPLVESLMDRRANPSFKRRASIVQTATPKVLDPRGKRPGRATSATKQRDHREAISDGHAKKKDDNGDCISPSSSRASREEEQEDAQKENEELTMLREQLDALHNILAERDEALKSAEESVDQMRTTYATFDELKRKNLEKDSLLSSTNSQLSNAKIQLAERQEALEKLENEARISNRKVQELQADMDSMDFENFALTLLFQELSKNDPATNFDENITSFKEFGHLTPIDSMSETELKQVEEARVAYIAAVAVAQENPTVESLAAAAEARLKLEAFVF